MSEPVKAADPCIFIRDVRVSYPKLFEPTQFEGKGDFSYSAVFHVEAGSENDKAIRNEIKRVSEAKWPGKTAVIIPSIEGRTQTFCYVDGRLKDLDGGVWLLTAKRPAKEGRPKVIDRDRRELLPEEGRPYAGAFVHAKLAFWAQDNSAGKGLRCTLVGVQFSKDGESFGGAPPASAEGFSELAPEETISDLM